LAKAAMIMIVININSMWLGQPIAYD
jgi:hypothetical protein